MSNETVPSDVQTAATDGIDQSQPSEQESIARLHEEIRRLENRNRRLQEQYESTQQTRSLQMVVLLAAVGVLAGVTAIFLPSAQEVLFTIAATGLFAAVLAYTLTTSRFIAVDVGEGLFESMSLNEQEIVDELGLSKNRVYVPTDVGVRLFVPEIEAYDQALVRGGSGDTNGPSLEGPFVVSEFASESGLSLRPTASTLLDNFIEEHGNDLSSDPTEAVIALREGVTDILELASNVKTDVDAADGRATFRVRSQFFGPLTRFDHPVASFFAAGLSEALSKPVELSVEQGDDETFVTCRWSPDNHTETDSRDQSAS